MEDRELKKTGSNAWWEVRRKKDRKLKKTGSNAWWEVRQKKG